MRSGRHTQHITDECKETNQDIVDNVDIVLMLVTTRDPADEEKHPYKTESCDQECVYRHEKT
jgi:hypothetical protein